MSDEQPSDEQPREEQPLEDPPQEEIKSVAGMKRAFFSFGTKTNNVMQKSLRNVQQGLETSVAKVKNMTDQEKGPDMMAASKEEALDMLKKLVESEKPRKQKRSQKWNFATVPLECFNKTLDDVFLAFIRWAKVEDSEQVNVTRAFERLTGYATWMDNTGRDMIDPHLTFESIKEAWKAWNMKVSYDKAGHFVWWLDIANLDLQKVKLMPTEDNLRLFVWFAHFAMFDPQAQQNGCVLVENVGKMQFWSSVTLVSPNLAFKIDRLTIGTMPVKMKQIYVCESPQWAQVLLNIMKPFLSKTVKARIVFLQSPKVLEDILGLDCIPTEFVGTEGKLDKDIVWATFSMD